MILPHVGDARWVFALLSLAVAGLLMAMALRWRPFAVAPMLALGLAAGGALGNGYDRAFRLTPAVIDVIKVNLTSTYSWPTFNVADAWLAIGVVWLLWLG